MKKLDEATVEVRAPFGWAAKFTGAQSMCAIVLILLGIIVAGGIWWHNGEAKAASDKVVAVQQEVKEEMKTNREALEAVIYVLSLPQSERDKLNLARPRKLVEMQR